MSLISRLLVPTWWENLKIKGWFNLVVVELGGDRCAELTDHCLDQLQLLALGNSFAELFKYFSTVVINL